MKTVPLGEVARFIRGVTYKPGDVATAQAADVVGVMRTKNVQHELDLSDVVYVPDKLLGRKDQLIRPGDILVSSANSWNLVGKCCWVPTLQQSYAIGGFITGLRVTSERLDARYLYLWLSSPRIQSELRKTANQTTNIANLNLKRCEALPIPLPPLDEQRRIAAILDQADAMRAKRRETQSRLDDLAEAIFLDLFNNDAAAAVPFDSIVTGTRNGLSPAKAGTVVSDVLTLSAVTQGAFDPTAVKSATFLSEPPAGMRVSGDDFLICRGNGNLNLVGAGVSPGRGYPDLTFPDTVIAASLDAEKVDPVFLEMAWRRPAIRMQVEAAARTTNGTYKINQQSLGAIRIVIPPLAKQQEFARRIRAIPHPDTSDLDALFVSLQSRAFSGQL